MSYEAQVAALTQQLQDERKTRQRAEKVALMQEQQLIQLPELQAALSAAQASLQQQSMAQALTLQKQTLLLEQGETQRVALEQAQVELQDALAASQTAQQTLAARANQAEGRLLAVEQALLKGEKQANELKAMNEQLRVANTALLKRPITSTSMDNTTEKTLPKNDKLEEKSHDDCEM